LLWAGEKKGRKRKKKEKEEREGAQVMRKKKYVTPEKL